MKNIYTDLALEEREKFNRDIQIEGVESYQKKENSVNMLTTVVKIVNEKGKETWANQLEAILQWNLPKSDILKKPIEENWESFYAII